MELSRKVIIFGAGKNGAKLMSRLGESNVYCFCDNYKIVGGGISQRTVIDFSQMVKINADYDIVLSTDNDEMRKQLDDAGVRYWEYTGTANNFFDHKTTREALDEELYRQYLGLDDYAGELDEKENWFRVSYNSAVNERLVVAMKNGDDRTVAQILSDVYDGKAGKQLYEDEYFENRPGMRLIAKLIRQNGKRVAVCDLACGHGNFLKELKSGTITCYGVDVSVERCKALNSVGIECKTGMLEYSGYGEESFDYVTMMECLEHVSDPFIAMKEAYRVLKKQGKLFVTVPYGRNCDSPMHVRQFYESDLYVIAKKCNYQKIKIMRVPYLNRTLDDNLFMVAEKG